MSRSLNKVLLIGNVGADPEVRTTGSGVKVASFSVATSKSYNDRSGQRVEKTEWHRLTAWDRLADLIEQYVKKGDRIYVEGSIEYSQTEDENSKPRYWTDIVVRELLMLGGTPNGNGQREERQYERQQPARRSNAYDPDPEATAPFPAYPDDDLPF